MQIRQNIRKFITASLVAVVAVSAVFAGHALAQADTTAGTANTLKISPLRHDIVADPGETKTVKIIVTNPSSGPVSVKPIQNDFVASDAEDGSPAIILDEDKYADRNSLKRYMQPVESFDVGPGESVAVEVTIVVPADAEAGGYFGAIRFAPTSPDGGGQVNTSPSVASLVLLRVNGQVSEKIELTDFQLLQSKKATNFLTSTEDLAMLIRFRNTSMVQLAPFGTVTVQRGNEVVHTASFNNASEQKDMVLPDSARRWNVALGDVEGLGRYKVTATFAYGSTNQTIEATQGFWVVPLPIIIAAAAVLVLVIALIVFLVLRRRRGNKSMSFKR